MKKLSSKIKEFTQTILHARLSYITLLTLINIAILLLLGLALFHNTSAMLTAAHYNAEKEQYKAL